MELGHDKKDWLTIGYRWTFFLL